MIVETRSSTSQGVLMSALDAQYRSHCCGNQLHGLIVHGVDVSAQSSFVHHPDLLDSSAGFWREHGQLNQQWPVGWGVCAGERHDHHGASHRVQLGLRHDDARSGLGHL